MAARSRVNPGLINAIAIAQHITAGPAVADATGPRRATPVTMISTIPPAKKRKENTTRGQVTHLRWTAASAMPSVGRVLEGRRLAT